MNDGTRDRDARLKQTVQDELSWLPEIDDAAIGVRVDHGVVTLTGGVQTLAERRRAVRAALRVRGVRTVVDDLRVDVPRSPRGDDEIAGAVQAMLRWNSTIPAGVDATVDDGIVTLRGEVDWDFQRRAARAAIEHIRGVRGVTDETELKARASARDTADRIAHALVRSAELDARAIEVVAEGTTVLLRGSVSSWAEKAQAERAAWSSPNVHQVENRIEVSV